jgi:hypothetical protein
MIISALCTKDILITFIFIREKTYHLKKSFFKNVLTMYKSTCIATFYHILNQEPHAKFCEKKITRKQ